MVKQIHLSECDSTQDVLKEQMAHSSSSDVIVVSCDSQIAGRGRGNNLWTSMPGTVCFSFNLAPSGVMSFTALEVSLLLVKYFEAKGRKLSLKWPNDIWDAEGKKCGGILVQGTGSHMLAGIGLNFFSEDKNFGSIYNQELNLDKKVQALELSQFILNNRYSEMKVLIHDWEKHCGHLGSEVSITENSEVVSGKFVGLGEYGQALLETKLGMKHLYNGSLRLI